MRSLHSFKKQEYSQESIFLLQQWEKLEKKMADYRNHLRFTIKCLKNKVIPVSVRLKTNVKTLKGIQIIRKAEKQLLNEHIRSINNTLELLMLKRDTCPNKVKELILEKDDHNTLEECNNLIERVKEYRHNHIMRRQKAKFEALIQQKQGGCSNQGEVSSPQNRDMLNNGTEDTKKWVRNLSSTPLSEDQERLLARGPKFSIKPRQPPVSEYVVTVEQASSRLEKGETDEIRVEVKKASKRAQCTPRPSSNISRKEYQALRELKEDKSRVILTADKGASLVIMDRTEYNKKTEELLNTGTYKKIPQDPTKKKKNKLISILKNIKAAGGLNEETYRRLYPTAAVPSKFYGLPKIHKPGIPLRPIVSSIGAATYNTAKELAKILKPLVGMSAHHVHNTRDFVEQIKEVRLKPGECIISYDVTALFTSVSITPVLDIIKERLANDQDLHKRTTMSVNQIIKLLEFCLNSTSFVYQGQFYQQIPGPAMGSPLSPIVANIFMEKFEEEALATAPHPTQVCGEGMWMILLSSRKKSIAMSFSNT